MLNCPIYWVVVGTRIMFPQQALTQEISMDNMEDKARQERDTLATRNARTDRSNNKHERRYKGKTRRKPSEKETLERRSFNPRGS